jgi:two-component system, sensor histidine kinase PdtaS
LSLPVMIRDLDTVGPFSPDGGLLLPLVRLGPWRRSRALGYSFGLAAFALALLLRWWLDQHLAAGPPFAIFVAAVIVTVFVAGLGPGIAVGVLSALAGWYFFLPPYQSFALDAAGAAALVLYVAIISLALAVVHTLQMALDQLAAERARTAELASQRELLFTELQHRIANNLQVVSALLNLQKASLSDDEARQALSDASQRLMLISSLNRKLHDPNNAGIDLREFLRELCLDVSRAAGIDDADCRVQGAEGVPLPADKAVPLALIVTELLNNSIEHGFEAGGSHDLHMDLARANNNLIVLTVRDHGRGLPAAFDLRQARSLGLRIVQALAQQIGASFEISSDKGTTCRLTFAV